MAQSGNSPAGPRVFYGWILVVLLLFLLSVGMGTSMYMYSVVAGAVGEEYAAGRFVLMAGSTGMLLLLGLCSPLLGTMLDRYPSKWILMGGAVVMGLGFVWIALSTHIWMVVASYILFIGVGAATLSTLTTATLLTRWFVRHRGLAIGIGTLGTQFGGFFYPPLLAAAMETWDWRIAIGGLGVLIMVIVPLIIWWLVVDRPEDLDLQPLGGESSDGPGVGKASKPGGVPRLSFPQLFAHRNFLLVVLVIGVSSATNTTLLANLVRHGPGGARRARGVPGIAGGVAGGVFQSLPGLVGRRDQYQGGDRPDDVRVGRLLPGVQRRRQLSPVVAGGGLSSAGAGGFRAAVVGHLYHNRVYGQVMGSTTLVVSIFTAAAPLFAGWVHDTTGSYRLVFITLLAIILVLMLCITLIRVPREQSDKFGAAGEELVAG